MAAKRPGRPRMSDAEWNERFQECCVLKATMPAEATALFLDVVDRLCTLGDTAQVPPKQMAVAAAAIIGSLCLTQVGGNVHADAEIDEFLDHCKIAMDVAVASMRLDQGWTPAGTS